MAAKEPGESKAHAKESPESTNQEVTLDLSDGSISGEVAVGEVAGGGDEETLEDIADDSMREAETFSESQFQGAGGGKMPSITLQSDSQVQSQFTEPPVANLEKSASSSIGDAGGRNTEKQFEERREKPERLYKGGYNTNMPAYEGSVSEEVASNRREMQERGMTARTFEDLRQTQRRVSPENPEMEARRRGDTQDDLIREYTVTELERPDDSPKDPMARKREYRTLKR
ncbi:hypothetical protein A3K73_04650 [Candidatus Pacearchaeota archaeon RBG_13_36_9]|nr:MAG: hypothetical protein A3K73_04650 [Candidatus Pacearchaeota archaeon RBG_13_36_9]